MNEYQQDIAAECEQDEMELARFQALDLSDDRFLKYVALETGITVLFHPQTYAAPKEAVIDKLKELFWDEFVETQEDSWVGRKS